MAQSDRLYSEMTMRDAFAMTALNGILAATALTRDGDAAMNDHLARQCYDIADAMLRASSERTMKPDIGTCAIRGKGMGA